MEYAEKRVEEALPKTPNKRKELIANIAQKESLINKKTAKIKKQKKNVIQTLIIKFHEDIIFIISSSCISS